LTTLNLRATKITDAGLKELSGLKNLTALDLTYTCSATIRFPL
jgi:internalin A